MTSRHLKMISSDKDTINELTMPGVKGVHHLEICRHVQLPSHLALKLTMTDDTGPIDQSVLLTTSNNLGYNNLWTYKLSCLGYTVVCSRHCRNAQNLLSTAERTKLNCHIKVAIPTYLPVARRMLLSNAWHL